MPSPRLNHSQRDSSEFHENNNIVSSPLHWQTKEEPPPAVADNFTAQQRTNPHNRCCADVIINHLQEVNQVSAATEAQTPTWIKWTSGCLHYSRGATIRLWKGLWTVECDRNKWFKSVLLFNGKALFAPAVVAALSFFRLQRINEDDGLHHMLEDCLTFNASPRRRRSDHNKPSVISDAANKGNIYGEMITYFYYYFFASCCIISQIPFHLLTKSLCMPDSSPSL